MSDHIQERFEKDATSTLIIKNRIRATNFLLHVHGSSSLVLMINPSFSLYMVFLFIWLSLRLDVLFTLICKVIKFMKERSKITIYWIKAENDIAPQFQEFIALFVNACSSAAGLKQKDFAGTLSISWIIIENMVLKSSVRLIWLMESLPVLWISAVSDNQLGLSRLHEVRFLFIYLFIYCKSTFSGLVEQEYLPEFCMNARFQSFMIYVLMSRIQIFFYNMAQLLWCGEYGADLVSSQYASCYILFYIRREFSFLFLASKTEEDRRLLGDHCHCHLTSWLWRATCRRHVIMYSVAGSPPLSHGSYTYYSQHLG